MTDDAPVLGESQGSTDLDFLQDLFSKGLISQLYKLDPFNDGEGWPTKEEKKDSNIDVEIFFALF